MVPTDPTEASWGTCARVIQLVVLASNRTIVLLNDLLSIPWKKTKLLLFAAIRLDLMKGTSIVDLNPSKIRLEPLRQQCTSVFGFVIVQRAVTALPVASNKNASVALGLFK